MQCTLTESNAEILLLMPNILEWGHDKINLFELHIKSDTVIINYTTTEGKQRDFIYGAVANDDVYRTITLYMTGVLDKKQTLEALKIRKLFNQMVFATEESLKYLHFERSELV